MKKLLLALGCAAALMTARADEGMWLPSLISKRIADMQAKGLKLTAEDLYSVNKSSLKDAIVLFGSGCTGEVISNEGLLLTNHHCGYGQIQAHSSVQNDYLTNGFWAMNRSEELPNEGLSVAFLVRMDDVTTKALAGVTEGMTAAQRSERIAANILTIKQAAAQGNNYRYSVEPLYYGNQYMMYTYEVFEDVRLVGAPPSAIGKFGGDTDNWMWPRHTGDFSLFRIYADKNNRPAKYSPDNVPYRPRRSLTISTHGVKEGDFTFVYGNPGSTYEYILSDEVRQIATVSDPAKIALRTLRLNIMNREQAKSPAVRIQYAAKNANVANAWKKWQGEMKGVMRLGTIAQKEKLEEQFVRWAQGKPEYEGLVPRMKERYQAWSRYAYVRDYYNEAVRAIEALQLAEAVNSNLAKPDGLKRLGELFFKNYSPVIDHDIAVALLSEYMAKMPAEYQPTEFTAAVKEAGGIAPLVDEWFARSVFTDAQRYESVRLSKDFTTLFNQDPLLKTFLSFSRLMNEKVLPAYNQLTEENRNDYRHYMRGLMQMQPKRPFYPDANLTLRIAYGKVSGFKPRDAVYYTPFTTIEGIMEKDNPEIYDYNIPQRLRDLYRTKDYGRWAVNGTVPVAFIASNHTTGGNSGSPILNARGELLGANFDRTWEGTMSDIVFDENLCRNISVDIRYVLFVIDRIGGAGYLINEMKLN